MLFAQLYIQVARRGTSEKAILFKFMTQMMSVVCKHRSVYGLKVYKCEGIQFKVYKMKVYK